MDSTTRWRRWTTTGATNQQRLGYDRAFTRWPARHIWFAANLCTGLLTIAIANSQTIVP